MKKYVWSTVSILVIFTGSIWYYTSTAYKELTPVATISITRDGFMPAEIIIKKGETVAWVNNDKDMHWPASNLHPGHLLYPEFDPRKPLKPGETWRFTFDREGSWKFHDHLWPTHIGMVTVE